jgi:hypothetical protein
VSVSGQVVGRRKASKLLMFLDLGMAPAAAHAATPAAAEQQQQEEEERGGGGSSDDGAAVVEVEVHANFTGRAEFLRLRQGATRLQLGDRVRVDGYLERRALGRLHGHELPDRFNKEKRQAQWRRHLSQLELEPGLEPEIEPGGVGAAVTSPPPPLPKRSVVVADRITVLERFDDEGQHNGRTVDPDGGGSHHLGRGADASRRQRQRQLLRGGGHRGRQAGPATCRRPRTGGSGVGGGGGGGEGGNPCMAEGGGRLHSKNRRAAVFAHW